MKLIKLIASSSWILILLACVGSSVAGCESTEKIRELSQENDSLRRSFAERSNEAQVLKDDIAAMADKDTAAERISELRAALGTAEENLGVSKHELGRCDSDRKILTEQVSSVTAEVTKLRSENEQLRQIVAEVNLQLARTASIEWKWAQFLQGAKVIAQDTRDTFLGIIDFTGQDPRSIFNELGLHGSSLGVHSIWSDLGLYGSSLSINSARNDMCINPPILVKDDKIVGYLSVNDMLAHRPRCDPYYLRDLHRRINGKIGIEN